MEGLGAEISAKIRAAIKAKLVEMGAYVDEELPDYVMVMVANKRTRVQMVEDLQLFLGKNTDEFTNWLFQVLARIQEVTVANRAVADSKKALSQPSSRKNEKKYNSVGTKERKLSGSGSSISPEKAKKISDVKVSKTGIRPAKNRVILMNSDDDDDDEDFINIKADAEAEALLKAELPPAASTSIQKVGNVSLRSGNISSAVVRTTEEMKSVFPGSTKAKATQLKAVDAASVNSESDTAISTTNNPQLRRVVASTKRPSEKEEAEVPVKKLAVGSIIRTRDQGIISTVSKKIPGAVATTSKITERLGVLSVKDRLGTRNSVAGKTPVTSTLSSRLGNRLGLRNPDRPDLGNGVNVGHMPEAAKRSTSILDRLGVRPKVTDRIGMRNMQGGSTANRLRKRSASGTEQEVSAKRVATEGTGSRLAQRLRELADGRGARVAHVPPNNIRTGEDHQAPLTSRVLASRCRMEDVDDTSLPDVAVPSVVKVTPRPRLPASMQANKNLLLKAVAEAQRSVAEAAITSAQGMGRKAPNRIETTEGLFTRGFRDKGRFPATPCTESIPEEVNEVNTEDRDDDIAQDDDRVDLLLTPQEDNELITSRVVVTGGTSTSKGGSRSFVGNSGVTQQITIQLSPDGDSSSEREEDDIENDRTLASSTKQVDSNYENAMEYEQEGEDEVPATTVAEVRPTVVTSVAKMDMEQQTRMNPQFVVTLDGLDLSMFPNTVDDDDGSGIVTGEDTMDTSKTDAGQQSEMSLTSSGRATIVQRVEPRLRLGPMPTPQHKSAHTTELGSSSGKSLERCKYWPACRQGDKCSFHHPTQTCRTFPACKFGEKCLYIHPNCKFDASCTRRDCPYTHSSPRLGATVSAPTAPVRTMSTKVAPVVCRFFPSCTNPTCKFLHPKTCRYGRYCVKPGCTFQHEGVPSSDKHKWISPFRA